MGLNIGGLLGSLAGDVIKVAGHAVGLGDIADQLASGLAGASPEQKAAVQAALNAHDTIKMEQQKLDAAMIHDDDDVEKTELQSSDKFTSRARPSLLYLAGLITAGLAVAVIFQVKLDTGVVSELLIPLWGHAGFYAYSRTKEKIAKVA